MNNSSQTPLRHSDNTIARLIATNKTPSMATPNSEDLQTVEDEEAEEENAVATAQVEIKPEQEMVRNEVKLSCNGKILTLMPGEG